MIEESLRVTRTTYRVSDFLSWQRSGQLDLRPPFQRGSVWNVKAKSFFIDSIIRGFPVPLIFIQDETDPKTYEPKRLVVDGQQRIRTVLAFVDPNCLPERDETDYFSILKIHNADLADKSFEQIPAAIRQRILNFEFSVHVLPSTTSNQLLLETFARMNSTGMKLNDQELRNARFSGALKQVAYSLAYEHFDRWLRWGVFKKREMARMLEVELTSELMMLTIKGLTGKKQREIDHFYKDREDKFAEDAEVRRRINHIFGVVDEIYGDSGSAPTGDDSLSKSQFRRQSWFYILFALIHDLAYSRVISKSKRETPERIDVRKLRKHLAERAATLKSGDFEPAVLKALRGASTDKSSRQARYGFLKKGLRSAS